MQEEIRYARRINTTLPVYKLQVVKLKLKRRCDAVFQAHFNFVSIYFMISYQLYLAHSRMIDLM